MPASSRRGNLDSGLRLGLLLLVAAIGAQRPAALQAEEAAAAWAPSNKGLTAQSVDLVRIHPKSPGTYFADVGGLGPARSGDGGATWNRLVSNLRPLPGLRDVSRIVLDERNSRTVYLVTRGRVYRSENLGDDWVFISTGLGSWSVDGRSNADLVWSLDVDPTKSVRLLAGTRAPDEFHGGLWESNDAGKSWNQIAGSNLKGTDLGANAWPIAMSEKTDKVVVVGGGDGVWLSEDRGRKFERTDPGGVGHHDVRDLTPIVPGTKEIYCADARGVWGSNDYGRTWSKKPLLEGDAVWVEFDPRQRKRLYAILADQGLFVSEDARHQKWTPLGHADLELTWLAFPPKEGKHVLAASTTTGLHLSVDEGVTFAPVAGNAPAIVPAIEAVGVHPADGAHLALTKAGVVFASADRAASWSRAGRLGQAPRFLRAHGEAGTWFAGGRRLLKSVDGGKTWSASYQPADPEEHVVALAPGGDGTLWILLERSSQVLFSSDGGKTWTPSATPVEASANAWAVSLAVDARVPGHLLASTRSITRGAWSVRDEDGGPYESWDGGKTWAPLRDGLFVAKDAKATLAGWNEGGSVAIDPATGTLYYAAARAGLFARLAAPWSNGKPPAEPWVNLARWDVPSPTIHALLVVSEGASDSRIVAQATGDNATRVLVEARGSAILAALPGWKTGADPKEPVWTRPPDPGSTLAGLAADPQVPGRLVAADMLGEAGVYVFDKPGGSVPPPPSAPPGPPPAPPAPAPEPVVPAPAPEAPKPEVPAGFAFSAGSDQQVRSFDLATAGAAPREHKGHAGEVTALAVSADGAFVASGARDKTVRLWKAADGSEAGSFPTEGAVNALLFAPDGKRLFAGIEEGAAVLVVDLASKQATKLEGHTGGVTALLLGADGTLWSAAKDRMLRSWDVEQGKALALTISLPFEPLALTLAPDGQRLFAAGKAGAVHAFSPQDGKALGEGALGDEAVLGLTTCPASGAVYVAGDRGLRALDPATLAVKATFAGPAMALTGVAASADGRWVLAGDVQGNLWLWASSEPGQARWNRAAAHAGMVLAVALVAVPKPPEPVPAPEKPAEPAPAPGPAPAPAPEKPAEPAPAPEKPAEPAVPTPVK